MATQSAPNGALPKSRLSETVRADDDEELDESEVESDAEEEVEVRWLRDRGLAWCRRVAVTFASSIGCSLPTLGTR